MSEDIFNPALAENSNIELSRYLSTLEGNTVPSFDTVPCEECGYSSSTLYIQIIDVPGEPTILEDEVEVCLDLEFQTFNTEDLIDILSVDTAGVWINTGADTIRLRVNGSTKFVAPDGVVAEGFSHTFAPMMIDGVTEYTIAYVQAQGTTCELVAPITFTGVNCTIYPSVSISETFEVEELPAAWNIQIESFS